MSDRLGAQLAGNRFHLTRPLNIVSFLPLFLRGSERFSLLQRSLSENKVGEVEQGRADRVTPRVRRKNIKITRETYADILKNIYFLLPFLYINVPKIFIFEARNISLFLFYFILFSLFFSYIVLFFIALLLFREIRDSH